MSAREDFEGLICYIIGSDRDCDEYGQEIEEILTKHAHELAEKIRDSHGRPPEHCSRRSKYTYDWHARRNADLIDPEQRT